MSSDRAMQADGRSRGAPAPRLDPPRALPLLPIATLVLWCVCLATGIVGLAVAYPRPHPAAEESALPPTQMLDVKLTPAPAQPVVTPAPAAPPAPSDQPPAPAPALPPALPTPVQTPALTAVAAPSPAISFAVPVAGLTRVVDAGQAGYVGGGAPAGAARRGAVAAPPPPPPPSAAVTKLTFGEGEGDQPPPEYPRQAVLAHQQGTVTLRFVVGEDGHVVSVEVISPARWPLLNQAAVRAVRDTWRFSRGARRTYEVPIQFQLN